jgi:hypothetical protein
MRLPSLRIWPLPEVVGENAYEEFTAGTLPVKRVVTDRVRWLVIVEHERGISPAFDRHLAAVRRGEVAVENVDYLVTWTGVTGGETRPTVIRLELRIDGLSAQPRLLFEGVAMAPLWMLADGAMLGLALDRNGFSAASGPAGVWVLGPTPFRRGLGRMLTQAGVPRPATLPRPPSRRRRSSPRAGTRRRQHGKSSEGPRKRRARDATRPDIEKRN